MKTKQIIAATVFGTTAMSAFSYIVSTLKGKNFKEPELLGEFIKVIAPTADQETAEKAGWESHYAIGLAFAGVMAEIWEHTPIKPSIASGALLGAASGVAGVMGWTQIFKLENEPAAEDKVNYYGHLILAHAIFGIGAAAGYKLFSDTIEPVTIEHEYIDA